MMCFTHSPLSQVSYVMVHLPLQYILDWSYLICPHMLMLFCYSNLITKNLYLSRFDAMLRTFVFIFFVLRLCRTIFYRVSSFFSGVLDYLQWLLEHGVGQLHCFYFFLQALENCSSSPLGISPVFFLSTIALLFSILRGSKRKMFSAFLPLISCS